MITPGQTPQDPQGWQPPRDYSGLFSCAKGVHVFRLEYPTCQCGARTKEPVALPAPPQEPPDPEQSVVMHLIQELKQDCCCAVCEVLREHCEETFGGDLPVALPAVNAEALAAVRLILDDDSTPLLDGILDIEVDLNAEHERAMNAEKVTAELLRALKVYGQHSTDHPCSQLIEDEHGNVSSWPCSCGLDDAIAKAEVSR